MATVYAIASAKGGVGKTTTTAAIATILADSGADVVAIDADVGMANLAGALGVTLRETTLHDVLADRAAPRDAVHDGPAGLRVVPGATELDAYAAADPSGLKQVVAAFDDADYVFVDAGAGLSHDSTLPLGLADETLLVSTPERSALSDTEKTRELAERLGGSVAGAAITRVGDGGEGVENETDDIVAALLDTTVLGRIPEDEAVRRAAEAAEPLPLFAPDSRATRAYRDLTRALTGEEIDGDGLVDGARTADAADDASNTDDIPNAAENDESDGNESDDSGADEEIIVAESEQAGLGEPGDEEKIIVADESPVSVDDRDDQDAEETTDGPAATEPVDDAEATDETVGDEHVDGDDLAEMIEAGDESTAGFDDEDDEPTGDDLGDDSDAIADADEVASQAGKPDAETTDGSPTDAESDVDEAESHIDDAESDDTADGDDTDATGDGDDIDEDLAESVPFRNDDTEPMKTTLSEGGPDDDADETSDPDETSDEKSGGFFSRLLGR